ncbi:MAG: signal recognition particle-docking protein FtsY [Clostridia bacterium]|nr:signal recognition particle-docking protein FtsY [Clostridia bacterium]
MGIFKKIKQALSKTRENFRRKMDALFSHGELDEDFFEELEDILISCDVGVKTSLEITETLRSEIRANKIRTADDARAHLKVVLQNIIQPHELEIEFPAIITVIGVNGVGKTTTIGKLANYFKNKKKSVTLVAGDTFRAAASSQLNEWADRSGVKIVKHAEGADAGAVVFDGIASAKAKNTDVLIIDTAGRLHTKTNLMEELAKINRIIERENTNAHKYTFIAIDATTGQNAISQVKQFNDYMQIDGIILTKLDGTAKGGVAISITKELHTPIMFVGVGEQIDDLEEFDAKEFVDNLF